MHSSVRAYAMRLGPAQDLKKSCVQLFQQKSLSAASIVSAVGSLVSARIRLAGAKAITEIAGPVEIVSLSGTLAVEGAHLHISVADTGGRVFGGHLMEGSLVYTTAELVIIHLPDLSFRRQMDSGTGYAELVISPS